jgi:hypothetical protein
MRSYEDGGTCVRHGKHDPLSWRIVQSSLCQRCRRQADGSQNLCRSDLQKYHKIFFSLAQIRLLDKAHSGSRPPCSRLRLWELLDVLFAFPAKVDHSFAGQERAISNHACRGRSLHKLGVPHCVCLSAANCRHQAGKAFAEVNSERRLGIQFRERAADLVNVISTRKRCA